MTDPWFSTCPAEWQPIVTEGATHLNRCLDLGAPLVNEWLRTAAEAGVLVPSECLIRLLASLHIPELQVPLVRRTVGERGRWLARQNPHWNWLFEPQEETARPRVDDAAALQRWRDGDQTCAFEAGRAMRERDPVLARVLMEEAFAKRKSGERESLVLALRWDLRPEDETFLISCMEDRSISVREALADVLPRFEGGEFERQAQRILFNHVDVAKTPLGPELRIRLPELPAGYGREGDLDPWQVRLARLFPRLDPVMEEHVAFLSQLVSLVRPQRWVERFGLAPIEIIGIAIRHEHWAPLQAGWTISQFRHRDLDWAEAGTRLALRLGDSRIAIRSWMAPLPDERREALLLDEGLRISPESRDAVIEALPRWGTELSRQQIRNLAEMDDDSFERTIMRVHSHPPSGRNRAPEPDPLWYATHFSLDTIDDALALITPVRKEIVGSWYEVLPLRREMRRTILEAAGR